MRAVAAEGLYTVLPMRVAACLWVTACAVKGETVPKQMTFPEWTEEE